MSESKGLSLVDYARKKRTADCTVCALPEAVRQQMRNASDKKIKRETVIAWLKDEHGVVMSAAELTRHGSGHHDS